MARLVTVTETINNGKTLTAPTAKAYGAKFIRKFEDISGATTVSIKGRSVLDTRVVSDTYADLKTAYNAAETTTNTTNYQIELNVFNQVGQARLTTAIPVAFPVDSIVEVQPDPDNAADSLVTVRNDNKLSDDQYIVDETVAAILVLSEA